jgi:hypothetical protein
LALYTKWAVRIKWLGYGNKWHTHTTKWYEDSEKAWEEADNYKTPSEWLDRKSSLIHN